MKVVSDNRINDGNWWVGLTAPEGRVTPTTARENMKSGAMKVYFATSDVAAAHLDPTAKGAKASDVKSDCTARLRCKVV